MEKADVQYQRMTETPIARLVTVLAIPTVISMLVTMFYNMADTYFVGTIGTSATGACGVVIGLMAILQAFGFMYGHGAGSHISRQLGAKEIERARVYASTSLFYAVVSGLVICMAGMLFMDPLMRLLGSTETILPYARIYAFYILLAAPAMTSSCVMNNILRYEGKAFFAMIGLTSGGILNIFGDAFLILGCHSLPAGPNTECIPLAVCSQTQSDLAEYHCHRHAFHGPSDIEFYFNHRNQCVCQTIWGCCHSRYGRSQSGYHVSVLCVYWDRPRFTAGQRFQLWCEEVFTGTFCFFLCADNRNHRFEHHRALRISFCTGDHPAVSG